MYFSFSKTRVKNPQMPVKKLTEYYINIIFAKDIFPPFVTQINLKFCFRIVFKFSYNLGFTGLSWCVNII